MRIREEIGRLALKIIFYPKYHFKFTYENFDRKRKDPYFLIGNHPSLHDPLFVEIQLINYPYPVAGNLLYTNPMYNFLLTRITKTIAKRKGQSDVQAIRAILNAFHKDKRGIMIFPEGNSSYFGQQSEVAYLTTAKLIKKVKHEVVLAKISGGYLAAPRWGKRRTKGDFHIHYKTILTPEMIEGYTLSDIEEILKESITFNDYDWNRKEKIIYKSKEKAIGLEQYIYACPICSGIQTIHTKGNDVFCTTCGQIAHFNQYEFLEGPSFDNLIDWDQFQKPLIKKAVKDVLYSKGRLIQIDFSKQKRIVLGDMKISLENKNLKLSNQKHQHEFNVDYIKGLVLTQKNFLSFDYGEDTYLIRINDPMLFLDSINYLKGE